jgi:hypothetical protein
MPPPLHLLSLPAEVRMMIWKYLLIAQANPIGSSTSDSSLVRLFVIRMEMMCDERSKWFSVKMSSAT